MRISNIFNALGFVLAIQNTNAHLRGTAIEQNNSSKELFDPHCRFACNTTQGMSLVQADEVQTAKRVGDKVHICKPLELAGIHDLEPRECFGVELAALLFLALCVGGALYLYCVCRENANQTELFERLHRVINSQGNNGDNHSPQNSGEEVYLLQEPLMTERALESRSASSSPANPFVFHVEPNVSVSEDNSVMTQGLINLQRFQRESM